MDSAFSVAQIRENERQSHIDMYKQADLFQEGSWLQKPVKTVMELLPLLNLHPDMHFLDLGCGVGRNSIPIAKYFQKSSCRIDCIDILDLAIEKLNAYANAHHVARMINGIECDIESFPIQEDHYDLILSVSSLEHVASTDLFSKKLLEIKAGVISTGMVCFIINSNIKETILSSGCSVPAQFEVNLSTEELQNLLKVTYSDWDIMACTKKDQMYKIPRGNEIHMLHTTVVTFCARKP